MTTTLTTTTWSLDHAGDELIHAVRMYNSFRNHPSPLCDEEAETVILASLAGENVLEPLRRFVQKVGSEDWDETNIFAVHVRGAWLQTMAALNEDEALEDEEVMDDLDDEELSIEHLTARARSVIQGNLYRKQFKQLLEDAERLDASDEELREALYHVIDTGGHVRPMEEFLSYERDLEDEYWDDDEDAAVRLLFHTITSPEGQCFLQDYPECVKFLI